MTPVGFLALLVIAALCGAIGQAIAGYSQGGCLFTIVIGFLGAWAGLLIADLLRLPEVIPVHIQGKQFPIVWSVIGAALLALISSVIFSTRRA